jgi:hypothetical protein
VKPSHLKTSRFPIARLGCLTAVLLGLATLCQQSLANAADDSSAGAHVQSSRVEPGASPEVAAGGTIVLRGSRSAVAPNTNPPNINPAAPNRNGEGYVSSNSAPAAALSPSVGWDRDLDVSGFDNGVPVPPTGTMGR